jgi:hypothetical protein
MLLNCIIGEMDIRIKFIQTEEMRRCAHIPLLIPVSFGLTVMAGQQHIGSNIKFTAIVE